MSKTIHFKLNAETETACRRYNQDISVNINWGKVTCRECLMLKEFLKKKRNK
jgi:late competence protein required for DNA uptake (superfamily II DNA/RNA helicase)